MFKFNKIGLLAIFLGLLSGTISAFIFNNSDLGLLSDVDIFFGSPNMFFGPGLIFSFFTIWLLNFSNHNPLARSLKWILIVTVIWIIAYIISWIGTFVTLGGDLSMGAFVLSGMVGSYLVSRAANSFIGPISKRQMFYIALIGGGAAVLGLIIQSLFEFSIGKPNDVYIDMLILCWQTVMLFLLVSFKSDSINSNLTATSSSSY